MGLSASASPAGKRSQLLDSKPVQLQLFALTAKQNRRLKKKPLVCNAHGEVDLHIHSAASDGSYHSTELLKTARKIGLRAVAITDHDTIRGVREAIEFGLPNSPEFITGVEISTEFPADYRGSGSLHILGYGFSIDDPNLNQALLHLQSARKNRNLKIIKRLKEIGFEISMPELLRHAGRAQLGRPHIAQMMVNKGWIHTIDEAFDLFLGQEKAAYVEKYRLPFGEAVSLIHNAGGIAVLAHPALIKLPATHNLDTLIELLTAMGLGGIESYYSEHFPEQIEYYSSLAKRLGLLVTGGTDYHGAIKPDVQMGCGKGNLTIPYSIYENLIQRISR